MPRTSPVHGWSGRSNERLANGIITKIAGFFLQTSKVTGNEEYKCTIIEQDSISNTFVGKHKETKNIIVLWQIIFAKYYF
jgi:hypothetical protein